MLLVKNKKKQRKIFSIKRIAILNRIIAFNEYDKLSFKYVIVLNANTD